MTKTLTEQWRDGTLEQRYYYVKYFGNCQKPFVEIELKNFLLDLVKVKDMDKIEVLAPVPSYDEYKELVRKSDKLKKKLEIATKALKEYADRTNWVDGSFMCVYDGKSFADEESAEKALKEMEGVK